ASLIEKEAYHNDERPVIAGVLVNRLQKNMLLQFDPTVIYGLGAKYDGTLHASDLKEKTPYNTYLNKGLPPTPIAIPSLSSMMAVMHPAQHDYLYFVIENAKRHRFSSTLKMHQVAVDAYRKQEKQK
ncbi:MAG TPA: endolytic transglycosylase MltG, partial [Myxococcota bacterium]|nr:endolytic transglycosylase MltG [Myxococcota bacterium]